jgi:hypothetical protein
MTRRELFVMTGWTWLGCTVFETAAYHLGAYEYFGDHPFQVLGFPWWISMANAGFIVTTGIAVGGLQPILRQCSVLAQILVPVLIYPIAFCGITYGTSFAAIDVLNTGHAGTPWMSIAAIGANLLTAVALLVAIDLLSFAPDHRNSLTQWLLKTRHFGPNQPGDAGNRRQTPAGEGNPALGYPQSGLS